MGRKRLFQSLEDLQFLHTLDTLRRDVRANELVYLVCNELPGCEEK